MIIYLLLLIQSISFSQNNEVVETFTQGKDFWVTFPPNAHVGLSTENEKIRDSLFLFFGASKETDVRVTYWDYEGIEYSQTFTIEDSKNYKTFSVSWWNFEQPPSNGISNRWNNGKEYVQTPHNLSFHIESDEPIIVLGHNQAQWSSDGMLVYPTKVLGNRYILACYNSINEIGSGGMFRASHFSIVATEDNTTVTIVPKAPLSKTDLDTVEFILNKGEVYYGRAKKITNADDITGTEVFSDKKIAIFSGVERTNVPNGTQNSRDYLITQLSPFETSGIEFFIVPFYNSSYLNWNPVIHSKFRILAYYDETDVYLNDNYITTLNKGEYIERDIDIPYYVKTSKTAYAYSIRRSSIGSNEIGDPFLLINPPLQHYFNNYKAINFEYFEKRVDFKGVEIEPDGSEKYIYDTVYTNIYTEHYLTILLKEESISKTKLDGNPLPNATWEKIYNTDYVFAHFKVNPGTHNVNSEDLILCFSYGYGYANSYGSVAGGLNVRYLDHFPPELQKNKNCDNYEITFSELNLHDTGLDSIKVLNNTNIKYNSNLNGDSLETGNILFTLDDPYQDGTIEYRIYDKFGLYITDKIEIPGFTLSQEYIFPKIDDRGHNAIEDFEFTLRVKNYGKFPQDLKLNLPPYLLLTNNIPNLINPNQEIDIILKIESESFYNLDDFNLTTILNHDCLPNIENNDILNLWQDRNIPEFSSNYLIDCDDIFDLLNITDSSYYDFGIKEIEYVNLENIYTANEVINQYDAEVKLLLVDNQKDGIYEIKVTDLNNNETTIEGIVQGFDFEFGEVSDSYTFEDVIIDGNRCDTILLQNNSIKELVFDDNSFTENVNFSIPQSQFPLIIPPKSNKEFVICFDSENYRNNSDYIVFALNECIEKVVLINSVLVEQNREVNSKCDLTIELKKTNSDNFDLSLPYPNPVQNNIKINLNNDSPKLINIKLINNFGEEFFSTTQQFRKGYYNLDFSLKDLPNGSYILVLNSNQMKESFKINVVK